jgi:hypothetical protein
VSSAQRRARRCAGVPIAHCKLENLSLKKYSPIRNPQYAIPSFGKSALKVYHSFSFNLRSFILQRSRMAESLALLV